MKRVIALLAVTAAILMAATSCTTVQAKDVDQGKIDRMMDTIASDSPS